MSNFIILKKSSQAIAWLMTVAMALAFAAPSAFAFEARGNTSSAKWVAQTPGASSGGATVVNAAGGDILNFSLTVQNTSPTDVFYSADALLDEAAPYEGGHELRIGATDDTVYDNIFDFTYGGPFVNNNRFSTFESGDAVFSGQNLTFNWALMVKAGIADGTYRFRVGMVQEYDAWLGDPPGPGAGGPNNNLGGRSGGTIFWDIVIGSGSSVQSGALVMASSPLTPAAADIADGGNANFTRFTLTAAPGTTVKITSLYVTREGYTTDSEVENVKLLDVNLVQKGNTAGGFNAIHQAQIFFAPALEITGTMDFYFRAGFVDGTTASHTARLGIADNADIVSDATSTAGPPVYGNYMTVIDVTLGTLTLKEDGSVTDATPDVGDTDVVVNTFKLEGGTTEDIIIEQISVNKAGSAGGSDVQNIELWDVTHAVSLGTVASWDDNDRATFPVNFTLTQGQVLRYRIQLDIVDGSGLTVNGDLVDGTDVIIFAKGALYGFYITPTSVAATDWTLDSGTGGTNNLGQGDKNQTINAGSLVISKSTNTAPTGNIAQANDQVLGTWVFEARGEPIRISALSITLDGTAANDDAEDIANFKSARLFDENGTIVAGPTNGTAGDVADAAGNRAIDFTQTFIVPVGVHEYTLRVNVQTGAVDTETVTAEITAAGDITAKTIRTNTSVTATGVASTLNTLTVQAAALASTTLTSFPVAGDIVPGIQDFIWMTGEFSAGASGEDVLITAAKFTLTAGSTADVDELTNQEIWADLDSNGTYETQLSKTKQNSSNNAGADPDVTFNFDKQTLTVTKGTAVRIAYIGDLSAAASSDGGSGADSLQVAFTEDVSAITAAGKDTGTAITTAPDGGSPAGQEMVIVSSGALTISLDSSTPLASLAVGGASKVLASVWRFAASNVEDIRIDDIIIASDGGTANDDIAQVYLYADHDNTGAKVTPYEIASGAQTSDDTTFYMDPNTDLRPVAPQNGYMLVYGYVDIANVDGTSVVNDDNIQIDIEDVSAAINATGMSSGADADPTATDDRDGNNIDVYKSYPTITLSPLSPSGNLTIGALQNVAIYRITADAADDITFRELTDAGVLSVNFLPFVTDLTGATINTELWDYTENVQLSTPSTMPSWAGTPFVTKSQVDYEFEDNVLTIPAGSYKDVVVKLDTTTWEDTGDSITATIEAVDVDFTWGVNLGGTYTTGVISARGGINSHTLVKAG